MKKLLLAFALLVSLVGCEEIKNNRIKEIKFEVIHNEKWVNVLVDKETGVEYIFYDGGYNGGLSPRYNADGTLKINEEYKGE